MPRQLDTAMEGIDLHTTSMNSTHSFILDSIKDKPLGETEHFVWFITDIGIAALFKGNENYKIYDLNVEKEAKNLSLDISKEEKEYCEIEDKKLILFYS